MAMKRVCVVRGTEIVLAIMLESVKAVDADGRAARGPATMRHHHFAQHANPDGTVGKRLAGIAEESYEAVYEPWMNGEQYRGCVLVDDPDVKGDVGGTWTKGGGFVARVPTVEEIAAHKINVVDQCKSILTMTAWAQAPDEPEAIRRVWAAYRQQVRDLMGSTITDPFNVAWPTPPAS